MLKISITADLAKLQRELRNFADKQFKFATAQALTEVAKAVQKAEVEGIQRTFPTATRFVLGAVRIQAARKTSLTARVFMMDKSARVMEPYLTGGVHALVGKNVTWWNPKHIQLDQNGNIPRGTMKRLAARPDVFIGRVKTKAGLVDGIWLRLAGNDKPLKGVGAKRIKAAAQKASGRLMLIARFGDALPVRQRLPWAEVARQTVAASFPREMTHALDRAMAMAR